MSKLKPCPFCGANAIRSGDFGMWYITCGDYANPNTNCPTPFARGKTIKEVEKAWNTRSQSND